MSRSSRREFIRRAGIGVAGISAVDLASVARAATRIAQGAIIPKHRALDVPGLHAYPMEQSVAAGETLELAVSSSVPYTISICRLGLDVDDPSGDTLLANLGEQPPVPQTIHPGSYVHIAKS